MIILGIALPLQIPIFNGAKNMALIRFSELNFNFVTEIEFGS